MTHQNNSQKVWALFTWIVAIAVLLSGCGQAQSKVYHVGILSGLTVFAPTADGFKEGMTELGYVEGKNIEYDLQTTNSEPEKERTILKKFVADKVDVVVVFPSEQAVLAKEVLQGSNIPMVFCQTNIEGTNLINNVQEPGGNITGVRYPGPTLALKRFEILHELAPQAKHFWVPYLKTSPIVPAQMEMLRPVAESAGITLVEFPAANAAELKADLTARENAEDIGIDAILMISEPLIRTNDAFPFVAKFAADHKLPMGGTYFSMGDFTTLFGVATDNIAVGKLVARQVNKIFKGISVGTIPVLSAEPFITLDYRVAQKDGLIVPDGLLKMANKVIR